jgi:tetratricopeptide (TPR) repeat protein
VAAVISLLVSGVAMALVAGQSPSPRPPSDAEFHLTRGESRSAVKDYDGAIAEYTLAIQLKPDYAEAYNDRGFAYYLKGEAEPAIADFSRAIALRPNYPKAYNSRGVVYMSHGYGSAKAVADFDRAIALKPDFRYAYINRANARLLSHPRLALADFHQAGMYPERRVAMLIGALVTVVAGIGAVLRLRARRVTTSK